jgi:hypothetical protein
MQEKETRLSMSDTRIDFSAPATLRKWPSVNKERVSAALGARPYMIMDGTLDECIERFMSQPESQHHLYEIHTTPQPDLVRRDIVGGPRHRAGAAKGFSRKMKTVMGTA